MANLYWPRNRFRSARRKEAKRRAAWQAAEGKAQDALVVSHGNCLDGITAAVVSQRVLGADRVGVCFVQPNDMAQVLGFYAEYQGKGRRLMVADLSLQPDQLAAIVAACRSLRSQGWVVEWRDHHHKQWEGLDLAPLKRELAAFEVNADATESGASLQQQALAPQDAFLRRLAETVRDRDLWWNKDPASEELEFALTDLGPKDFSAHLLAMDSAGPVLDKTLAAAAKRERDRQKSILDRLLAQARFYGEGPTRVGVVYGWLPKNTGLHELLADHACRIAVNVRPNGKLSLRSERGADVCHLVARDFAGGGHPNASGADLRLKGLGFWWYVLRRGRVAVVDRLARRAVQALRESAPAAASGAARQAATAATSTPASPRRSSKVGAGKAKGTAGRAKPGTTRARGRPKEPSKPRGRAGSGRGKTR